MESTPSRIGTGGSNEHDYGAGPLPVVQNTLLRVDVEETVPRDADAESGLADWRSFQPPTEGYRELVFRHVPVTDAAGRVQVELKNPAMGVGLRWNYDSSNLPHLFQWKMMGQGMYVLGVEPANSSGMGGRAVARESGDLPHLEPGESRRYELELEVIEYPQVEGA